MMDVAPQPGTNPMMGEAPPPMPDAAELEAFDVDKSLAELNLAETIRKRDKRKNTNLLDEIGMKVCREYEFDETSRSEWLERNKEWMKLATQVVEKKMFPWEGAANVKYPLLTTASIQFGARAYPSLVPAFDIVKAKVMGPDPDGSMTDKANTLSTHMSYQILYEMDGWEEDMDILCFILPIIGVVFKKTYYSEIQGKNISELVHAKDFVVNYYTKSLAKSARYTHILFYTPNEIKEKQNFELFLEYDDDFGPGKGEDTSTSEGKTSLTEPGGEEDDETPRKILEQYRYLDLDEDGYKEPYIVTVDYDTRRVLRITPNFRTSGVQKDGEGKIKCITPAQWFTKFGFIPNPDGGFYDLGFGLLLGGINESVNTLTNQLLDSGTLNNLNAGFLAKGLRIGGKDLKFKAGEWKVVNAIGDDLRKSILPLPANAPSQVLFELLGTLAQAGKELASVAEIFTGKMPGQNTPAATTMATIEQGLKVFTSIYKRIYRSMQQEFTKLFELNRLYMPTETVRFVAEVNGVNGSYAVSRHAYQEMKAKILPAADPNMVSETQKLLRISGLQELAQFGHVNTKEMTRQSMTYQGQENIQELMNVPPPPPPLEIQLLQMELQDKDKDRQLEAMKIMSENQKRESEIMLNMAKAKQLGDEEGVLMLEQQLKREEAQMDMQMKMMDIIFKKEEFKLDMQMKKQEHELDTQVAMVKADTDIKVNKALGGQKIEMGEAQLDQAKRGGDMKLAQGAAEGEQKLKHTEEKGKADLKVMDAKAKAAAKNKPKGKTTKK
jgi:chaperonin GroES